MNRGAGARVGWSPLSRRQLLHAGAAGSVALWAAGLADRIARATAADTEADFAALSPGGREILAAVAPVLLDGLLPADPAGKAEAIEQTLRNADMYLSHMPEAVRAEADQAFALLGLAPVRIGVAGVWPAWPEASQDDIAAFLRRWQTSYFTLLRTLYVLLQSMVSLGWFDQPRAWTAMGYGGPPPGLPVRRTGD